jgi:Peptidase of plants and bacteria/F5/8 type C domain
MHTSSRLALVVLVVCGSLNVNAAEPKPVAAVVESTLATEGKNIRQFAFDGDPNTYFASDKNPGKDDTFTLIFDAPVTVKTVAVITGKPDGADKLTAGSLEGSEDGKKFTPLAKFGDGAAHGRSDSKLKAIRIRPGEATHPLIVREFTVESEPPVATFKYPVEIVVSSDDPEMLEWVTKAGRICEKQYDMICNELRSDGFKPRTMITMAMRSGPGVTPVAATGGGRITGNVAYFSRHKDDYGAMVHETVHVVQGYRRVDRQLGWLVEGIPDYIRFFIYEPGKIGRINPNWNYERDKYRAAAHFINYIAQKYDKDIVRKINAALREGDYKEELWELYTKKKLKDLGEEWKATLKR